MICPNPECFVKFSGERCPSCGTKAPKKPKMVQQWNSTLKANPKKRPKNRKGDKLKKAMLEKARETVKNSSQLLCTNCGISLPFLRYSNISHIEPRSTAPEKREDKENMEILCSSLNYWGKKDESCHTVWERNNYKKFAELENSRIGEKGT